MNRMLTVLTLLTLVVMAAVDCKKDSSSRQSAQSATSMPDYHPGRINIVDSVSWFSNNGMTFEVSEASIDDGGKLQIVLIADDLRATSFQASNGAATLGRARKRMAGYALFQHADDMFKMFPSVNEYHIWVVNPSSGRDRYGNVTSTKLEMIAHLSMTRSTSERMNWSYMRNQWMLGNFDFAEIASVIDSYIFDRRYFE